MTQFEMKADIVQAADGMHHVRFVTQYGPVANVVILPPDAMEMLCANYADVAARVIPECHRMNAMRGFEVVSGDALPKLPPIVGGNGATFEGRTNWTLGPE